MKNNNISKTLRARELGVSLRSLYYKPKKPKQDWKLKSKIEEVLREHPSYGHRRLALHLHLNKKKINRVMKLFGIKAYRRRSKKWKKIKNIKVIYPNRLMTTYSIYPNHIWTADFTHLNFQKKIVYISTVMDLFTRRIIGVSILTNHTVQLVISALMDALHNNPKPRIFHSDNGSEYNSEVFLETLQNLNINISRSAPGCPWENGYQESFHSQFKIDFGDPSRFETLGELVYEIYQTIWRYNNTRIHTSLKMPPNQFALLASKRYDVANKVGV